MRGIRLGFAFGAILLGFLGVFSNPVDGPGRIQLGILFAVLSLYRNNARQVKSSPPATE